MPMQPNITRIRPYWVNFIEYFSRKPSSELNRFLFLYFYPIVFICGLTGNSLSAVLMFDRRFRRHSYSAYIAVLAASDSVSLIGTFMASTNLIVYSLTGDVIIRFTDVHTCRLPEHVFYASSLISSWIIVSITLERCFAVVSPFTARIFCTRKVARIVTVAVVSFSFAFTSYAAAITSYDGEFGCFISSLRGMKAHYAIAPSSFIYSPICIITLLNVVIIRSLSTSSLSLIRSNKTKLHSNNTQKITVTVLAVSITFLILLTPMASICILVAVIPNLPVANWLDTAQFVFSINYAVNFYIYCLTGTEFRKTLKQCFQCRKIE
ncbi:uncharacterized protein LOC141898995 [Tubulanus polymorphus]|uniref:uncharacterized protein LOC141898995 n=1 Tax=Tubulanus polymorphus TaxID=672921 RepID=UPI003DA48C5C